jgi:hypothetical protein
VVLWYKNPSKEVIAKMPILLPAIHGEDYFPGVILKL